MSKHPQALSDDQITDELRAIESGYEHSLDNDLAGLSEMERELALIRRWMGLRDEQRRRDRVRAADALLARACRVHGLPVVAKG